MNREVLIMYRKKAKEKGAHAQEEELEVANC